MKSHDQSNWQPDWLAIPALFLVSMLFAPGGLAQDTTLTVTSSGMVGIGTSSPVSELTVDGTITTVAGQLPVVELGTTAQGNSVTFHSPQSRWILSNRGETLGLTMVAGALPQESLSVRSDGLDVYGAGEARMDLRSFGNTSPVFQRYQYTTNTIPTVGATVGFDTADRQLKLLSGGNFASSTNGIIVSQHGFVGIGRVPVRLLDIEGPGTVNLDVRTSSATNPVFQRFFYDTNLQGASIGFDTAKQVVKLIHGGGFATSTNGISISGNGNVGFGVELAANPIQTASGAYLSAGGAWVDASSRLVKTDIAPLPIEDAKKTVDSLMPVTFTYTADPDEGKVGFIAEDVPDLVATNDRNGLSALEIVAVLTKVVQDQQRRIEALEARLDRFDRRSEVKR